MAKSIGIDLGTTNSVMAEKKGKVTTIQNIEGEDSTPSIVGFFKGQIIVGSKARDKMVSSPENTIISIKRLMGRAYSDEHIQRVKNDYLYKIVSPENGTEDDLRVLFNNKEYSPIEISSLILKKLKEDAQDRLGVTVESAVITVPAYFSEKQRDATRKAGQLAGLKVQKILNEPTAAAIAYGVDNVGADESKTVLVYDLGGGTFDVSILMITGGVFAQLNIEGDMWLGGNDFDQKIMDYVVDYVQKEYKIDTKNNLRFMIELRKNAEKAKIELSSMKSTEIIIMGLLQNNDGNLIDITVELTRDKFESMIKDLVMKSIEMVKTAIKGENLTEEQIDNIILVGGSSRIPMIHKLLKETFGEKKILQNIDEMKCVAYGASIVAARTEGQIECSCGHINSVTDEKCSACGAPLVMQEEFVDITQGTANHYGIQTEGDKFEVIIPKGSTYPSPHPHIKEFITPRNNMRRLKVPVYSGMSEIASKNEKQLTVWMELPENVPAQTHVDVAFELDNDGILKNVKVSLKDGSGREIEVFPDRGGEKRSKLEKKLDEIKQKYDKNRIDIDKDKQENIEKKYSEAANKANENNLDEMEKKLQEMEKEIDEIVKSQQPEWVRKAEGLLLWTKIVIDNYGWLVEPDATYKINKLVEEVRTFISKNDEQSCDAKTVELNKELDKLPGLILDIMYVRMAAGIAENNQDLLNSDKLWNYVSSIQNFLNKRDFEAARGVIRDSIPLCEEIFKKYGGKTKETQERDDGLLGTMGRTKSYTKSY